MTGWHDIQGVNRGFVLELYERFRREPSAVDAATRSFFEGWTPPPDAPADLGDTPVGKIVGAVSLADAIRRYGHLEARIDPLGRARPRDRALVPETHGVTEQDLRHLPAGLVPRVGGDHASAWEAIQALRRIYCASTGYDYAHIFVAEEREWLHDAAERGRFRAPADPIDPLALLARLTDVEVFERFLHRTFPGKTRFSIEGLDMLVPILDEVIGEAAEADIGRVLIGMAHRGRLNVLAHVLHKPYEQILAEFKDPVRARSFRDDMAWTGDVKYHLGAHRAIRDGRPVDLEVSLPPNPSHLEAVNPVVVGMARAAGTTVGRPGEPKFDPSRTLPILVHGDASFPGQGVVAETLNFNSLPGYSTGGTIHVIANNQLGFTTDPADSRSTLYASGLARGFKIPIVHVNADDPEACLEAARLAFAYRARFRKDFLIDLVGYRRYGHNEADEPSFTQPLLYAAIAAHPPVREVWARTLSERGGIEAGEAERLQRDGMRKLQVALEALEPDADLVETPPAPPPPGAARDVVTAVPLERLRELNAALLALPEGFQCHRKIERARERRKHALDRPDQRTIDWAAAEELAFGSIVAGGTAIRLTGEDVERGTFSQRHAVFHDVATGARFVPLQALPQAAAAFEIHDSPLTENAVVGFEYGYNVQAPDRLVIWEAQYGDFVNGAQVVLDEFLLSARAKWGQTPSLVLLLPHGHEGQGPDHASARPERFLQLAADANIRLVNCTTAAQYFHLLRRQALLLQTDPLPLVVLTPKSLLRHPLVASAPRELAEGRFQLLIPDAAAERRPQETRRLILCSGKVYVDLVSSERYRPDAGIAICRVEQLYPFPRTDVAHLLDVHDAVEELVWVQEEPENMGAWEFIRPLLAGLLDDSRYARVNLRGIARARSSSPAEGSMARHMASQEALVTRALTPAPLPSPVGSRG